jgi:hypothetical protein
MANNSSNFELGVLIIAISDATHIIMAHNSLVCSTLALTGYGVDPHAIISSKLHSVMCTCILLLGINI